MKKKIAIIDGDVLAYQCCEQRWKTKAQYQKTSVVNEQGLHEEIEVPLIEIDPQTGKRKLIEYTAEEDRAYLEKAWKICQEKFQELLADVFCTDYVMGVKGDDNFRNMLFPEYKLNRHKDPTQANKVVPALRKLMVLEDMAVEATGREADDLIRIWAEQAKMHNIEYVICSIDKDLKCIPGIHFNMKKREFEEITEHTAMIHYYEQILKGDPTDFIPGIPGMGPKTATKRLMGCETHYDCQEVVLNEYMSAYGDEWHQMLLSNAKMIHIQRTMDDYFNFDDWPIIKEVL